jgi:ribonuclease J
MVQYSLLAQNMGYQPQAILLPQYNQTIDVTQEGVSLGEKVDVKNIMVDGLGVGDVGSVVLRDRQVLAEEGVVVAVIEVNQNDFSQIANVDLITRGFIFAKENTALLNLATAAVKKSISARQGKIDSTHYIRQLTGDVLENFFWEKTRRRPMILPVIVEV